MGAHDGSHLHLISDATGTTLLGLARACLAQFEDLNPTKKFWPLVRTTAQLERVIKEIERNPGPVIFTMVDKKMRKRLQSVCESLNVPCIPVLDPILRSLSAYYDMDASRVPGLQHALDDEYFKRVSAIDFALAHDDGKKTDTLAKADIILVGVSRTSKTPTAIYLARRGIKTGNIPLVPNVHMDESIFTYDKPMYVGLTTTPERLMHLRRTRLKADDDDAGELFGNDYLDIERIEEEVKTARKLYQKHGWPVINVTKRSVEETAAEILSVYHMRKGQSDEDA